MIDPNSIIGDQSVQSRLDGMQSALRQGKFGKYIGPAIGPYQRSALMSLTNVNVNTLQELGTSVTNSKQENTTADKQETFTVGDYKYPHPDQNTP